MTTEFVQLRLKRNRGWPWPEESWGLTPMYGDAASAWSGIVPAVPRNVVTLAPRLFARARPRRRAAIEAALDDRFRFRRENNHVAIDFPKSDHAAKQKVVAALDEIDPGWRRVFVIYPRD